jgi:hypothetical protein
MTPELKKQTQDIDVAYPCPPIVKFDQLGKRPLAAIALRI